MEAIMKAFEKMEKREERRKEALARIGPGQRKSRESCDSKEVEDKKERQVKIEETPSKQKPVKVGRIL